MRDRPLYVLACTFAGITCVLTSVAQHSASRAAAAAAQAMASQSAEARASLLVMAQRGAMQADSLSIAALTVFVAAVCVWLGSLYRHETGLQSVPLLLLSIAAVLQLLLL